MLQNIKKKLKNILINRELLQWAPVLWIIILFVIPLFSFLLVNFFYVEIIGVPFFHINTSNLLKNLFYHDYLTSLVISLTVAFVTTFFGFFLSFFTFFLRSHLKKYIIALICLPVIINPIIQFYSINSLFSTDGIFNNTLLATGIISELINVPDTVIYSLSLFFRYLPFSFFFISILMSKLNILHIEAAIDLGLTRYNIFFKIILKKTFKGILASFGIVAILSYGNFSSAVLLPIQDRLFATQFIKLLLDTNFLNASAFSISYAIFTILFILFYNFYLNRSNQEQNIPTKKLSRYQCLAIAKSPITLFINCLTLLFIHIVLLFIIFFSFNSGNSLLIFEKFSIDWYLQIFNNPYILLAIKNSFIVSTSVAIISTILGGMFALSFSKNHQLARAKVRSKFTNIIRLPLMLSEVIFCSAALFFLNLIHIENLFIGQILTISIITIFVAIIFIYSQLQKFDLNMESAALDLGADYIRTFRYVTLPSILPSLLSCFIITFVFSFNEFAISYLITRDSFPSISSKLVELISQGASPLINALSTLIIVISLLLLLIASFNNYHIKFQRKIKLVVIATILFTTFLFIII